MNTMPFATGAAALFLAFPAFAQSLLSDVVGAWDISAEACAVSGTSLTRIEIAPDRIDTYGGNAVMREVEQIGAVIFVAADFQQLEGVEELAQRTRTYFRLSQKNGPDRMKFVWKDVQTVDLVRCGAKAAGAEASLPTEPEYDGPLPITMGLWVVAGESCQDPANASWRVYDGGGLRGASSTVCEIDATEREGDSILFSQLCTASYDDVVRPSRDRITITAPLRFTLVEGGEGTGQDFNWCGPELQP